MNIYLKTLLSLAFIFLLFTSSYAQIAITGKVTDAENGETLPGVSVVAGQSVTMTNGQGVYNLTVSQRSDSLKLTFSCIGYVSASVTVKADRSQTVNFALKQDHKLLREVVVNGQPYDFGVKSPQMGAIAISQAQIKSLPVVFGEPDLLKTLQATPGVQSGRSGNAGIMVRGGYFDQNSLTIDGGSLYSTEHLRGFVSAVNPDMISTLAFYRGAFPANYSGRLSSIIDITAKEGDFYNYHGEFSVGTALGHLSASGPIIKGKTSFAVAARMSYFGLIYQRIVEHHYKKINERCPYSDMSFWDVNAKIVHKLTDKDKLSLTFVKDYDSQTIPERDGTHTGWSKPYFIDKTGHGFYSQFEDSLPQIGTYDVKGYSMTGRDETRWGNTMGTVNWNHKWEGTENMLNVSLSFTGYDYKRNQRGISTSENKVDFFDKSRNDSIIFSNISESTVGHYSKVKNLRLSASMTNPVGEHNTLIYGLDVRQGWYRPGRRFTEHSEKYVNWCSKDSLGNILTDHRNELTITDTDTISVTKNSMTTFNLFVGDEFRFKRFRANLGVNLALYKTPHKAYFYPEPRVAMSFMLAANTSIKASATRISQAERLLSSVSLVAPSDIWVPATDSVPPMRSTQFGLSLNHQFPLGIDLSVEGYYKSNKGNIDYLEGTEFNNISTTWERQITIGKSRSYGVEVLLQKFAGSLNGWISYTWSRSFDKYDAYGKEISNGKEIPSLSDRPHNLAINVSKRVGMKTHPRNHWDYSVLFKYMSGRRVTLPDYVSYAGMMTIADHYYGLKNDRDLIDPHFSEVTGRLIDDFTLPSEAFDIYMRFNGYSQRYNYKLPYEMTLDVNISLTMCHRFGESKLSFGVTNLLNRKNVSNIYMGAKRSGEKIIVGVCDFPITPSLTYTYSF